MPTNNAELFAAVQRWCQETYGLAAEGVSVHVRGLPQPVFLPIFMAAPAPAPQRAEASCNEHEDEPLPLCVQEILQTLRDVGKKLSLTRLKEEMDRRGRGFSRSTLAHYCAELVQDGTLLNPDDLQPRGYSLPEWDEDG